MNTLKQWTLGLLCLVIMIAVAGCGDDKDKAETSQSSSTKMTTIGIINYLPTLENSITLFKTSMAALGYVEGENVTYIYPGIVPATPEDLDPAIQALIDQKVDLIVSIGTPTSQRAKEVTAESKVPVIFTQVVNPVGSGLVTDPLKPGGNLTGIDVGAHIIEKAAEWLLTVDPSVTRVYVPYTTNDRAGISLLPLLQASAEKLSIELVIEELATPEEIIPALEAAAPNVDAVFYLTTSIQGTTLTDYVAKTRELQLPVVTTFPLAQGGTVLVSITVDFVKISEQTARLADQIIKGVNPGDIPVEQAAFSVDINLEVANLIGLEVPDRALQRANNIYREIPTPVPTATATTQP